MSRIFCVTDKMTTMCQSDAILNFCNIEDREFVPKAMLESLVSRIFWVTEKVVGNGSGTIACNFVDTKIRLMYVSCVAFVFNLKLL